MDFTVLDPPLNVLVVHGDVPPPDRDACSLRLLRIVEQMVAEGHRVTFLARGGADQIDNSARLLQMGVAEVFPLDAVRLGERFPERGWRFTIETLDLKWLLDRGSFDVAWLSLYDIAEQYTPLLRQHSPATRVVVDSSDIQWIREHRGATLAGDPAAIAAAERTRERERAVYGAADVNVAISEVDGQATRELAPDVPVQIVSLVEDFPTVVHDRSARSGLLFVGNFWHAPNVDAVTAFHRDIWPLVRAAVPGIHLTVAGSAPPEEILALAAEDVIVTGWVPELEPYMAQAMISIAPLRYGAGIKGKIVQAIAAGLPVVTTAIGTEGMGLTDGEHLLVADDPADFAAAIARLHTDEQLWYRLATEAPKPLASRMGPEAARAGVRRSLRAACPVRWQARADGERLGELLTTFTRDHVAGDPITLTLTVPADDPDAPQAAFERVTALAAELVIDLDDTADIQIVPWAPGTDPLPRTVMLDAAPSAATASAPSTPAATGRRGAPRPKVAIALQGALGPRDLHAQLELLGPAIAGHDAEVVVIAFGHNGATSKMLAAQSGARIIRTDKHPGREQAQRLAIEATSAPVLITLGPMALPQPGLVGPLLEALDGGASFAGAGIDAEHGLHVGADGSLWPLRTGDPRPITALPFDCLAATREVWEQAPVSLPMREGLPERQLADWALARGPLVVHPGARVHRTESGPVSVIICTRNRAEELPDAVALLAAHGSTVNGNEVIIVDNGSTDATPDVARELAARYPGVRVVHEDNPGLSHARNAGARAAANAFLCYLDDDARPAPRMAPEHRLGPARRRHRRRRRSHRRAVARRARARLARARARGRPQRARRRRADSRPDPARDRLRRELGDPQGGADGGRGLRWPPRLRPGRQDRQRGGRGGLAPASAWPWRHRVYPRRRRGTSHLGGPAQRRLPGGPHVRGRDRARPSARRARGARSPAPDLRSRHRGGRPARDPAARGRDGIGGDAGSREAIRSPRDPADPRRRGARTAVGVGAAHGGASHRGRRSQSAATPRAPARRPSPRALTDHRVLIAWQRLRPARGG